MGSALFYNRGSVLLKLPPYNSVGAPKQLHRGCSDISELNVCSPSIFD